MNVEIGDEAAQFPEKEYRNGIAFAVYSFPSTPPTGFRLYPNSPKPSHLIDLPHPSHTSQPCFKLSTPPPTPPPPPPSHYPITGFIPTQHMDPNKKNFLTRLKKNRNSTLIVFLKVHKNENFFGFGFEFCIISLLVMSVLQKKTFWLGQYWRRYDFSA